MRKDAVQQQKHAVLAGSISLCVFVPLSTIVVGTLFHVDRSTLTSRDVWSIAIILVMPCTMLWLSANVMQSLQIQLEDDHITRIQDQPLGLSAWKISFARQDIGHIREVQKAGLYLHGRNSDGRWIDLHVPRMIENYDDLRARLAAWQPIHETWI